MNYNEPERCKCGWPYAHCMCIATANRVLPEAEKKCVCGGRNASYCGACKRKSKGGK